MSDTLTTQLTLTGRWKCESNQLQPTLKHRPEIYCEKLTKTKKNFSKASRRPGRNSNWGLCHLKIRQLGVARSVTDNNNPPVTVTSLLRSHVFFFILLQK